MQIKSMKELEDILRKFIEADEGTVVTIAVHIPEVTIRLHDSRTMLGYGIDCKEQIGFALEIAINKNSKKGKNIVAKLKNTNQLSGFKEFGKSYVKDFETATDKITQTIEEWLSVLDKHRLKNEIELNYTWPIEWFRIIEE